jgi:osmotically-inducible protein OsmY
MNYNERTGEARSARAGESEASDRPDTRAAVDGDQPDEDLAANLELIVASTLRDGETDDAREAAEGKITIAGTVDDITDEDAVVAVVGDVDGVTEAVSRLEIRGLAGTQPSPAGPQRGGTER